MSTGTTFSLEEYLATAYEPDCDFVDGCLEERNVGEWDHSLLQAKIAAYFVARYGSQGIRVLPNFEFASAPTGFAFLICVFS